MKEVYEVNTFIKLEGMKEFRKTNWLPDYECCEERKELRDYAFCETFDDLKTVMVNDGLLNSKMSKTLFGKDVCVIGGEFYDSFKMRVTEKNFRPAEIKVEYTPANLTIEELKAFLTAEDFISYVKSHCDSEKVVDKVLNL